VGQNRNGTEIRTTIPSEHLLYTKNILSIYDVKQLCMASRTCTDPHKVNIIFNIYHVGNGQPWILPNFRTVEQKMLW
jgi:uncharacterized Fe-S cluster protein YjdI